MSLAYKQNKDKEVPIHELEYIKDGTSTRIYTVEYTLDGKSQVSFNLNFSGTVTNSFVTYGFIRRPSAAVNRLVGETQAPAVKYTHVKLTSAVTTGDFKRNPLQTLEPRPAPSFFQPFVEYTDGTRSEWNVFNLLGNQTYTDTRTERVQDKTLKRIGIMSRAGSDNYSMTVTNYSLQFEFIGG